MKKATTFPNPFGFSGKVSYPHDLGMKTRALLCVLGVIDRFNLPGGYYASKAYYSSRLEVIRLNADVPRGRYWGEYQLPKKGEALLTLIKRGHITSISFWEHWNGYADGLRFSGKFEGIKIDYLWAGFGSDACDLDLFGQKEQMIDTETMVSLFEAAGSAGMQMPAISAYKFVPKPEFAHLF